VELAVLRGYAELANDDGRTPLRAGQRAHARANAAPSSAYAYNSASWDAFDRWAESRRDERLGASAQYLPEEVRPYTSSFDRNGSWRYETSYGYVWYPTVAVDWRPYHNGRWVTLRPYGWTWVGVDPWDWPTHHYGRWGISAGAWFWIPGRSWGPAWVSWAYSPGYVSWCPLGWNNRPVVFRYGRGYDRWRVWSAVPERRFGGRDNVRRVMTRDFDVRTPRAFVTRDRAPEVRGIAVPRSSAPIRMAGTAPGRRGNSPVYTNLEPGASRVGSAPSRTIVGPSRSTTDAPTRSRQPGIAMDRSRAVPRTGAGPDGSSTDSSTPGGVRMEGPEGNQNPARQRTVPPSVEGRYGTYARTPGSTAVRRGTAGARGPERAQDDDNRATFGGAAATAPPTRSPSHERVRPAPSGDTPYVAPRGVPRDHPVYRPMPAPAERGSVGAPNAMRTPAPSAPRGRPADGSDSVGRGPERRAPERAPDSGARAVPRAEPRADRPPSSPGAHRGGSDRPSGGSANGGRSRSGGRGR
jgi:hypothetical protein